MHVSDILGELLEPEYEISACYFPGCGEAELTWRRVSDGRECALTVELTEEQGNELVEVIGPCVYYGAAKRRSDDQSCSTGGDDGNGPD